MSGQDSMISIQHLSKTILFLKSCCSHLIRTTDIQHHEVGIWTTTLNAQKVIIDWILTTFVIG